MPQTEHEGAIAAFIKAKGVTRCPTACAAPSQSAGNLSDRAALRARAERMETLREAAKRHARTLLFPAAA